MLYLYLFSLIFGGVLLGGSILLGGKDDLDAGGDGLGGDGLDGDGLDGDGLDGDGLDHTDALDHAPGVDTADGFDADGDGSGETIEMAHPGAFDALVSSLRSTRFWTFFFAFFGLTGLVLDGLNLTGAGLALGLALAMGTGSGALAAAALRALQQDRSGVPPTARDYIGKSARVLVRVEPEGLGKVRLELGGRTVDVLARLAEGEESFAPQEEALIIEMDGTEARIARVGKKAARD